MARCAESRLDLVHSTIYWSEFSTASQGSFGQIWRADLDGNNPQVLVEGTVPILGVAVEPISGKLYWTNLSEIYCADLDGKNAEPIVSGLTYCYHIAVIPEHLSGDLNADGVVNSGDLDLVRSSWGTNSCFGDANGDGTVNSADLDIVRANWGARAAAVPAPGSILLVLVGTALLAWRRRR